METLNTPDATENDQADATLAADEASAFSVRIQAEASSVVLGNNGKGTLTSVPKIVSVASLDPASTDVANADAADGDAYVDFSSSSAGPNVGSGEYIEFTVNDVPADGWYDLAVGYALSQNADGSDRNRSMRLDVNNKTYDRIVDLKSTSETTNTGDFTQFDEQVVRVKLVAGANTVRLSSNGFSGPNVDYLEVREPDPAKIVIQAEDLLAAAADAATTVNRDITLEYLAARAQTTATTVETFRVGAEGDGYLDWAGGATANTIDIPVTASIAGEYSVLITYVNGSTASRPLVLSAADGTQLGTAAETTFTLSPTNLAAPLAYPDDYADIPASRRPADGADVNTTPDQSGWEGWTTETLKVNVALDAGVNVFRLTGANGPNIDKIEFVLVEADPVAPTDITVDDLAVAENADGAVVGALSVTDPDSDAHTFQVFEGEVLSTRFEVADGNLRLKAGQSLDFETESSIAIRVVATDAENGSVSRDFVVAVANDTADDAVPNTAPHSLTLTGSVAENAAAAVVGTLSATDAEGDTVVYTTADVRFEIVGNEIRLVSGQSLNHETDDGTAVSVTATDEAGASTTAELMLNVDDINEAPTLSGTIAGQTATQGEGKTIDLSALAAADVDAGDVATLGARLAGGGALPAGVTLDGSSLLVDGTAAAGSYEIEVFATDGDLDSNSVSFSLDVEAPAAPFQPIYIQGEAITILPDGTASTADDSLRRTQTQNPEPSAVSSPADFDQYSLRPGYTGAGYLDLNGTSGAKATFPLDLPAGTYEVHLRLANGAGGTGNGFNRPVSISVDGVVQGAAQNTNTGSFGLWQERVFTVNLAGPGPHTIGINQTTTNGAPNIDAIAITEVGGNANFGEPVITTDALVAAENQTAAGAVQARDADGDRIDFSLSVNAATDNALFTVDPETGALTFKSAPDFEAAADSDGDNVYTVEVAAFDGTATTTETVSVTVTNDAADDNRAPTITTTALVADENQTAAGTIAATDADADALAFSLTGNADSDNALFSIDPATGALSFRTAPDFEALGSDTEFNIEVAVSDGTATTTKSVTVTVADVAEGGPVQVSFDTVTSYTTGQDKPFNGPGYSVSADKETLTTTDNVWKRVGLDEDYAITSGTKIVLDLAIGANQPEIVAVGFDLDGDAFDGDGSIFQLGGTQTQGSFIDLRGKGVPNGDGTTRFTIDLGAHAGTVIGSLVFISDDDSSAVLGSATFSNVQIVEAADEPDANVAPRVVGGGIADISLAEQGSIEVDLPFVDDNGDALTYTVAVTRDGAPVQDFAGFTFADGVMSGDVASLSAGTFAVTVTASDGKTDTSDTFNLTVEALNQAPVADEDAALEPYAGATGQPFQGVDLNSFSELFSDPDGDALTLTAEGLPKGLSVNAEGVITGSPTEAGSFSVIVRATDAGGLSDTITLKFEVAGPAVGDRITVEAESFTGLSQAENFFASAATDASGDKLIRVTDGQSGTISTQLAANGLTEGWYSVAIVVFDETDGAASLSLKVGDVTLQALNNATGQLTDTVVLDNNFGVFLNSDARGTAAQSGNLKQIAFETVVYVDAETIAELSGQANAGELIRVDQFVFTKVNAPANEAPVISGLGETVSIAENTTDVATLSITDADNDDVTVSLSGADAARFAYNESTGKLSLIGAPDAENPADAGADGNYQVTVTATDGTNVVTKDVTVSVTDTNESISVVGDAFSVAEGVSQVGSVSVTDEDGQTDGLGTPSFAITGGADRSLFTVDARTGAVSFVTAPNFETPADAGGNNVYAVEVTATDGGLSDTQAVEVTVSDVDEAPFSPVEIQAEAGVLTVLDNDTNSNDTTIRNAANPETGAQFPGGSGLRAGYTGGGYVDFGDTPGDKVTFNATVAEAGTYDLNIRYASNGARPLSLVVNGGTVISVPFAGTDIPASGGSPAVEGFNNWVFQTVRVTLEAGQNSISLAIPGGRTSGPNIDRIEITEAGSGPIDRSADEDSNLFLSGPQDELSGAAKDSINFQLAGIDADISKVEISFDNGATRTLVAPDADGDFVADGSALAAGSHNVTVYVTDEAGNVASSDMDIVVASEGGPTDPFTVTIEGESFTSNDTTGTGNGITQARTASNPEPNAPLLRDANGDNLWDGFTGQGYLDMGGQVGDTAAFSVSAPEAGTYTFTFRYSNGGAAPNGDRPMTLTIGGQTTTVSFPGTDANGWDNWKTATVEVKLAAGVNAISIANTVANGPNIDNVTISRDGTDPVDTREQQLFEEVVKINFEPAPGQTQNGLPAGYATPAGYLADTGAAFGDRGNGLSYGWVTEASVADGTANGTIGAAQPANAHWYKNTVTGASELQKTYAHFEYPGAAGTPARAWEMELANGTYQVTLSVGDTAGAFDSNYVINVEGQEFGEDFVPANPGGNGSLSGGGFRSTLVTGIVQVTDGRLTVDSIGGVNTEIQYLEVDRLPELTPGDGRTADLDYSFFTAPVASYLNDQVPISIGENGSLPTGINPLASFVVGVNVQAPNHRGPNISHVENIKLVETLTGKEVAINVQISGGADSLTIRPLEQLKENTSYTLKVDDVLDLGSITDGTAPLRQMQDLTTTFVTGEAPEEVARDVAFTTETLLDGFADGAGGFTTIEFGPDGKLYVATIMGDIHRWDVNSDGSIDKTSQETLSLDYLDGGAAGRRGIIGFTFDPSDPETIWITDNYPIPRENKAFDTPEFSGRVSKITLGDGGSFQGVTAEAYITGLPRSGGDHLTNSLEFRANPNAGQAGEPDHLLYLTQGSNSAAGAPDGAWGNRPERLLNAAVLEIDPDRDAPNGGFNVRTEPVTTPTTTNPASSFNPDGTFAGFYNPFATDAVLKIYATGVRNAYDLVWHSNGHLYAPTNGTASGGRTPDDPDQAGSQVISNSPKQYDYLFTVEEGGYYGHPNPLRDEYVLNGGNPTAGVDPNEVTDRKDGNPNTDGYDVGVRPESSYDLDGTYNLGYNQSPNGAIEYKGGAFGANLKGAILFAQFSTGDNVRTILVDASGKIVGDDVLRRPDGSVIDDYIDPLDIIENPVTGQLYLMTLNRGTGASQLILLTPAPGGVTQDVTADEGGNLALAVIDASDPSASTFQVNGLDDDITAIRVSFNNGSAQTVTLDAQNRFTVNLGTLTGSVTARLEVTDDSLNRATTNTTFTPGQDPDPQPGNLVPLVTIQAEDNTPADGTSVSIATGATAQIQVRTTANPEPSGSTGLVGGLRPGAFGLDGNTNNTDGVAGGYADFGATNADFVTFNFDVPADQTGAGLLKVRYGNGGTADRPLEVFVNGVSVGTFKFSPPAGVTGDAAWSTWQTIDVPANLVAGLNTVTFRATANTGPNIDQIEVLVPEAAPQNPTFTFHEAENAALVGAKVITEDRNQEGAGFVDFDGTGDQTITWTVNSAAAGSYEIAFRYALAASKADRPLTLTVNGVNLGPLNFKGFGPDAENTWDFQEVMVNLVAGANTIKLTAPNAVGPNIDQLRVATGGTTPFEPDYVQIAGETRIELEQTADNSTRILNNQAVEFYFTAGADGLHAFDLAANAGAPNGGGLKLFLNGVAIEELAFPGTGTAGEQKAFVQLEAGTEYQLRVISNAPGASAIDYLDVRPVSGNANADIAVQSLDPAFLDNRLHFSYIEDPNAVDPTAPDRDMKDSGTVRITNTGTEPLSFIDFELDGPFVLANPAIFNGLSLAAGRSLDVTVLFNRAAYTPPTSNADATSTVFGGSLKLVTNDAENPISTIDLAGFWQARDEGGQEPNVNEVWKIFGFGNVIEGLSLRGGGENSALSTKDVFASTDETEVLSPYWQLADGVTQAKITQIAAFHGTGGATIGIHNPGNKGGGITFWNHEGTDNQRLLPNSGNDTSFSTRSFGRNDIPDGWAGNDKFGITVAGLSTDPRLNPRGNEEVSGAQQGHTVKMFQALDADGKVIPNVYLGIMDYTGINYDYNDNLFVVEGVAPVGFGQNMVVAGLDDAAADDRLVFTNIDSPANGTQAFRNEATFTISNDGFVPLGIEGISVADPSAFQIVGTVPTSVAAGGSVNVTVRFVGTHSGTTAGADLFKSTLTIRSNDFDQGQKVINLAGLAQEFSENNSEPNVAQIVEAFGYGTDVAQGELAGGGAVETIGDEVLMPYLQRLDGTEPVEVIQIAAFLNQGNVARLGFHGLNSSQVTNLFANDDQQGQTVLPDQLVAGAGSGANVARGAINQNGPFGLYISVDGRPTYSSWSDPEANEIDPNFGQLVDNNEGHLIRYFKALDAAGKVIEGTYIGIQDYPGASNFDYNDHMFVIKNVKAYELTTANDANNNKVNDALEKDTDADGRVDFFDTTNTPPPGPQQPFTGTAPSFTNGKLTVDATNYDTGGQNVAYSDNSGKDGGNTGFRSGDAVETVGTENDIGYVRAGEWIEYTVNVPANGVYNLSLLAKTPLANASVAVSLAGGATLANVALQDGGTSFGNAPFQASAPVALSLPSGQQTIRLTFNGTPQSDGPYLLDLRSFSLEQQVQQPPATQTPFGGTAPATVNGSLVVDASNYDNGGQGIAYNDRAGLQGGTNGGRTGSTVESTTAGDIGWIENGEWLEYTVNVAEAGAYDVSFLSALGEQAGGRAITASFEQGGTVYKTASPVAVAFTGGWTTFKETSATQVDLKAGVQTVRVAFNGGLDLRSFELDRVEPVQPAQTPFSGTPVAVGSNPVVVNATQFDRGGQGIAFSDTTPTVDEGGSLGRNEGVDIVGNNAAVGWINNGEWIEYTVNLAQAGTYDLSFLSALGAQASGRLITASFEQGGTVYGTASPVAVAYTGGWSTFKETGTTQVDLKAGVQTVRVTFNGGSQDFKSFELDRVEPPQPTQSPFSATPVAVGSSPVVVNAALFDRGGQGIAFNDTTPTTDLGGTAGRNEGVDIVGNNSAVGWIENGEWVEYTINVQQAGAYDVSFLSALGQQGATGRSITASFEQGGTVYKTASPVAVAPTGGWGTFKETAPTTVDLKAGVQTVRLTFNGGSMDLKSFELEKSASTALMSDTASMQSLASFASPATLESLASQQKVGTASANTLKGDNGVDSLAGLDGNDRVMGMGGNDLLLGGAGADRVDGGKGADLIAGGAAADRLFGGDGVDALAGGTGNDELWGGSWADHFVFVKGGGRDLVKDFQNTVDLFDLRQVAGINGLKDLSITRSGDGVLVSYGSDSFLIDDTGLHEIGIRDFVFADNLLV